MLPSGALRVQVYAGVDAVTKKRLDLEKVIPAEPNAEKEADDARIKFLVQIAAKRQTRTNATVTQLLERYIEEWDSASSTRSHARGYVRKHIGRFLGDTKVGGLEPGGIESFYAECRRCRDHCGRKPYIQHRVDKEYQCDSRCRPHKCKVLASSTIRHTHSLLSGAYEAAVRRPWVSVNPLESARPPAAKKSNPSRRRRKKRRRLSIRLGRIPTGVRYFGLKPPLSLFILRRARGPAERGWPWPVGRRGGAAP